MLVWILKNTPSRLTVTIFIMVEGVRLGMRFFLGTVWGILFLSLSVYYYTKYFTSTPPLAIHELIQWTDTLPSNFKIAILTATVTVFGFIIAFYTAMANWRSQMKAQMMLHVSSEVDAFFSTTIRDIQIASLYIEGLIRIDENIEADGPSNNASFEIGCHKDKAVEFYDARQAISRASIEIHNLANRVSDILAVFPVLEACLKNAINCLSEIAEKTWLHIPIVNLDESNHTEIFTNQIDRDKYHDFVSLCERNGPKISASAGAIRGGLNGAIIGGNIFSYSKLVSKRKTFIDALNLFFKNT